MEDLENLELTFLLELIFLMLAEVIHVLIKFPKNI